MNILLVPYYFAPAPGPRSIRWSNLARFMAERGHDVTVMAGLFTPDDMRLDESLNAIASHERITVHRIPLVRSGPTPYRDTVWAMRAARRAAAVAGPHDVLISSALPIASHGAAWKIRRQMHSPLWIADYGDPWSTSPMRCKSAARHGIERVLERGLLRDADAVTLTTRHSIDLFRRVYGGHIDIIPQGASLFHLEADWSTTAHQQDRERPVTFFYAGGFYKKWREPTELFKAFRSVQGARLVVCGSHQVDLEAERQGSANIELHPPTTLRNIVEQQQEADVLVVLSSKHRDQIPGKIYEYLGTGRAVLYVTNHTDDEIASLCRERACGSVSAFDAAAIRESVSTLCAAIRNPAAPTRSPEPDVGFNVRADRFLQLISDLQSRE